MDKNPSDERTFAEETVRRIRSVIADCDERNLFLLSSAYLEHAAAIIEDEADLKSSSG